MAEPTIITEEVDPYIMVSTLFKYIDEEFGADRFSLEHEDVQIAGVVCPLTETDLDRAMEWLQEQVGAGKDVVLVQIHYEDVDRAGLLVARGAEHLEAMVVALKQHPVEVYARDGRVLIVSFNGEKN